MKKKKYEGAGCGFGIGNGTACDSFRCRNRAGERL